LDAGARSGTFLARLTIWTREHISNGGQASYGLTRAEAQVALQASRGPSVAEIAARLNISQNTVKTQLRHVYAKTEVRGQAELAILIASLKVMTGNGSAN
jgi:DNA-binding CsgD family transcriptional regulator